MLRGGSFDNTDNNVRCAYRNRNNPNNRNNNRGFRIVVLTFFRSPEMPAGYALLAEVKKKGGAASWPCRLVLASGAYNNGSLPCLLWSIKAGREHLDAMTYATLHSWGNLLLAYRKAAKGKRGHPNVARFEFRLEDNLLLLQDELRRQTYRPGDYAHFYIHEPKRRLISAAPFRDRVVHHALCNGIEPSFERFFIPTSYANRVGKGTHRARQQAQVYARRFRYFIHLDIIQFFPDIDHATLRHTLRSKVKDPQVRWLIDQIMRSGEDVHGQKQDDRRRGLPIGNLTSQFWANVYLNPLDHFIKRSLGCKGYLRYVDDLVLFANSKQDLHDWHACIDERLGNMHLHLHAPRHPHPVEEGIPFLGFVIFPESIRLKRRKGVYYRRKLKGLLAAEAEVETINASIHGWLNHTRYGNTKGLQKALLTPLLRDRADLDDFNSCFDISRYTSGRC